MNDKDTYRMHTKVIQIGDRKIGGGNPIAIQSMTNTKTAPESIVENINYLLVYKFCDKYWVTNEMQKLCEMPDGQ